MRCNRSWIGKEIEAPAETRTTQCAAAANLCLDGQLTLL